MLVDSNNNVLDTSKFSDFDEGSCAILYRYNNILMKSYKLECKPANYFSKKTFDRLKQLNLDSIVKLYNYYYNDIELLLKFILPPSVYTMKYIYNPKIILLNQTSDYLLDIVSKLEKDVNILSNNKILMFDAHYSNIIFQENKAKIIDIDLYRNAKFTSYKTILIHNKIQLLNYIVSTLRHELEKQNYYNYKFENLFLFSLKNTNVTDYLNKILTEKMIGDSIISKIKK